MVVLLFGILLGLPACGFLPHKAEFLTETEKLARADLHSNGILAFTVQNETQLEVEVDFVHEQSQRKYRVDFSPSFKRGELTGAAWKVARVDVVSDSVAMFQLPAGIYRPVHILAKIRTPPTQRSDQTSTKAKGPAFEIVAGKITSAGRLGACLA